MKEATKKDILIEKIQVLFKFDFIRFELLFIYAKRIKLKT